MDTHTAGESLPVATDRLGRRIAPRRHRTVEEKVQIVEESLRPGASAAEVARRYEVNANLLFSWRRQHEQGVLGKHRRTRGAAKLLPVTVRSTRVAAPAPTSAGTIEIELPCGVLVRVVGEVPTERLAAVLSALGHR